MDRGTEFNLLLTDVMMPDVDGPALLHRVREDPILAEMPVVMMSSNEHADVVLNCLRLGAEDYLLKPVTKKAVKHMWAHVWRRKQRNQMVPRFENGAEVVEEDEFHHRMRTGDLVTARRDLDGVVAVPEPDEFSSDGGTDSDVNDDDDDDDAFETDEQRETKDWREREFASNSPSTTRASFRGGPMAMVREGFAEGPVVETRGLESSEPHDEANGAGAGTRTADDGQADVARGSGVRFGPSRAAEAGERNLSESEIARLADPLLVPYVDPAKPGSEALRRLAPMAPIEGLAEGARTVRDWIDDANEREKMLDRNDALHVLSGAARLLRAAHDKGTLLGAMRASALMVTPQGEVGLAPPRPNTPPRRGDRAGAGGAAGARSAKASRRRAGSRVAAGEKTEPTDDDDDDDDAEAMDDEAMDDEAMNDASMDDEAMDDEAMDARETRFDAAAASSFFSSARGPSATASAASNRDPIPSKRLKQLRNERHRNENLYVSPEERAGLALANGAGAPAECFALGVLMVEMCWPEVASGARGDVGALLAATLRPDGSGVASLAKDPEESALAKRLLQPVPGNRPNASDALVVLESVAARRDAARFGGFKFEKSESEFRDWEGWRTARDRGMASEKRRADLIALAGFLRANREAKAREARAHKVRSALLAHALRQLGAGGSDGRLARRVAPGGPDPASVSWRTGVSRSGSQGGSRPDLLDRLSSGDSVSARRGVSFDLGRDHRGAQCTSGDAPPGEKPSKRRRAPSFEGSKSVAGTETARLERVSANRAAAGLEPELDLELEPELEPELDLEPELYRNGSAPCPSSASARLFGDGGVGIPARASRPPSRQARLPLADGRGGVAGHVLPEPSSQPRRRLSLDRARRPRAREPRAGASMGARSFSAGDLSLLDAKDAAVACAVTGHKPATELDDAAFEALEETFFESCARAVVPVARAFARAAERRVSAETESARDGGGGADVSSGSRRRSSAAEAAANAAGAALSEAFASFGSELAQCVRKTRLKVIADVSRGDVHSFGEMICSVGWDRDGEYVAAAGISKRLRIFETAAMTDLGAAVQCPVAEMRVNAKLSSLAWNPYVKRVIASADYEGAIQLWDANVGARACDLREHEKRVWSLDFSTLDPTRLASGSDDGTVRVWSTTQRQSVFTIRCRANVCSVQFSPANANVVAFSSADHKTHVYDLRRAQRPLAVLSGHKRAVSYVKWLGAHHLVTASTDNTLKLWDVTRGFSSGDARGGGGFSRGGYDGNGDPCVRTFTGHANRRNFVGMDVSREGRVVCGSEDNAVCLYSKSAPSPIARQSLAATAAMHGGYAANLTPGTGVSGIAGREAVGLEKPGLFVSAVSWSPGGDRVLAANSCGAVKVLQLTHDE